MADPLMTGNVETNTAPEAVKVEQSTIPSPTNNQVPEAIKVEQSVPLAVHESTSLVETIIKVIVDIIAKITGRPSPTGGQIPTRKGQKIGLSNITNAVAKVGSAMESAANTAVTKTTDSINRVNTFTQQTIDKANENIQTINNITQQTIQEAKDISQATIATATTTIEKAQSIIQEKDSTINKEDRSLPSDEGVKISKK